MDMAANLPAGKIVHGVAEKVSGDCLYNILHKFRTVGFNAFPFLCSTDTFISDGLSAKFVFSDAWFYIAEHSAGREFDAQVKLESFALLFEFDGDQRHIRHVLYNCAASRPGIEGKTNEDTREVQTETLTIKATPLSSGLVKAKTGNTTDTTVYNDWYKAVYMPTVTEADDGGVA